jgi:hypothetical protein
MHHLIQMVNEANNLNSLTKFIRIKKIFFFVQRMKSRCVCKQNSIIIIIITIMKWYNEALCIHTEVTK